jgi:hypothetical protein
MSKPQVLRLVCAASGNRDEVVDRRRQWVRRAETGTDPLSAQVATPAIASRNLRDADPPRWRWHTAATHVLPPVMVAAASLDARFA